MAARLLGRNRRHRLAGALGEMVALDVEGHRATRQQIGHVAQRHPGRLRRQGRRREAALAGRDLFEVLRCERVGEGHLTPGPPGARQHAVLGEDRGEARPRKRGDVPAEAGRRVDAGEERGLAGGALRQAVDAERGVEATEQQAVGGSALLHRQRPAEERAQSRRRLGRERVVGRRRCESDAVDEEQENAGHGRHPGAAASHTRAIPRRRGRLLDAMSGKDKTSGMKSAYELALERLESQGIDRPREDSLSEDARQQIAEIRRQSEAKLAELEILHRDKLRKEPDPAKVAEQEDYYLRERQRIERERERKIEQARRAS